MTPEDLAVQVAALQKQLGQLAAIMSAESAYTHGNTAVICGLVTAIGHLPGVGDSVRHQLESLYASMLGRQRNEINLHAFEERAELFKALLAEAEKSRL